MELSRTKRSNSLSLFIFVSLNSFRFRFMSLTFSWKLWSSSVMKTSLFFFLFHFEAVLASLNVDSILLRIYEEGEVFFNLKNFRWSLIMEIFPFDIKKNCWPPSFRGSATILILTNKNDNNNNQQQKNLIPYFCHGWRSFSIYILKNAPEYSNALFEAKNWNKILAWILNYSKCNSKSMRSTMNQTHIITSFTAIIPGTNKNLIKSKSSSIFQISLISPGIEKSLLSILVQSNMACFSSPTTPHLSQRRSCLGFLDNRPVSMGKMWLPKRKRMTSRLRGLRFVRNGDLSRFGYNIVE